MIIIIYICRCATDRKLFLAPATEGAREDNSMIRTADSKWWKIEEKMEGAYKVREVLHEAFSTDAIGLVGIPWDLVGIVRFKGLVEDETEVIPSDRIIGKVMRCGKYLIEYKRQWFYNKV